MTPSLKFLTLLTMTLALGGALWAAPPIALGEEDALELNVKSVDLPDSHADRFHVEVDGARFGDDSARQLAVTLRNINFREGRLGSINADISDATLGNVPVAQLHLTAGNKAGGFAFDSFELLNNRRLVLSEATPATVTLEVTEDNLNRFLSSPKTLSKLEGALAKKTAGLSLVRFTNPSLDLISRDRVKMNVNMVLGEALNTPLEMVGQLDLDDGRLQFKNMTVNSNGSTLPVDVASILQSQMNKLIDFNKLGDKYVVIYANNMRMGRKTLLLDGTATLKRLEFGL